MRQVDKSIEAIARQKEKLVVRITKCLKAANQRIEADKIKVEQYRSDLSRLQSDTVQNKGT